MIHRRAILWLIPFSLLTTFAVGLRAQTTPVDASQISAAIPAATAQTGTTTATTSTGTSTQAAATAAIELAPIVVTSDASAPSGIYTRTDATTATRLDVPIRETPFSVGILTDQLLQEIGAQRAEDAVQFVSGVSRISQPDRPQFVIRGFDISTQQYVNGFRDSDFFVSGNFVIRDLANIDHVEILKGMSSVLYGDGEPGGVVNYITKKPEDTFGGSFTGEYNSAGLYREELDVTGPATSDGSVTYRFIGANQNGSTFIQNSRDDRMLFAPSLQWKTPTGGTFLVEYEHEYYDRLNAEQNLLYSQGTFSEGGNMYEGYHHDTFDNVRAYFTQPLDENWTLRVNGQYSHYDYHLDYSGFYYASPGFVQPFYDVGRRYLDLFTGRTELVNDQTWDFLHNRFLVGFEYIQGKTIGDDNTDDESYALRPVALRYVGKDPVAILNDNAENDPYGDTATLTSGYALEHATLWDKLHLLAGVRYSYYNDHTFLPGGQKDFAHNVSPTVGAIYDFSHYFSLYGNWGRSFSPNDGQDYEGNEFKPTLGEQFEVGFKGDALDQRLTYSAAAYQITQTNILTEDPIHPDFSKLLGTIVVQGLEFDVAGKITDKLQLIADASVYGAKITSSPDGDEGDMPSNIPYFSAGGHARYQLLDNLYVGASLTYVGKRQGDDTDDFQVPSYFRFDMDAGYEWKNWEINLAVQNITNTFYIEASRFQDQIQQGPPLNANVSVRFKF